MRLAEHRREDWREVGIGASQAMSPRVIHAGLVEVVRLGMGEPLVLVPGLAGGWRLLLPLARMLARHHRVLMIGLRGDRGAVLGRGEAPAEHADDLAATLDELGIERPTVLGVSFGGAIALELATRHPSAVGGLVVSGAEARFRGGLGASIARRVLERYALPTDSPFLNQFFNLLHGRRPDPGPLPRFIVDRCWETDQGTVARRLRALDGFDVSARLDAVEAPSLVVAGTRDVVVPPARQRALAQALPRARFAAIEDAGHVGFLTHRAAFAREVGRWVRHRVAAGV